MSAWIVYSKDGHKRCEARKLEYSGEFMGACSVSVTISSPVTVEFGIGDYIMYRGERFEMNYDPTVVKTSSVNTNGEGFVYNDVIFNSLSDELTRCDFLDYVSSDNLIHYSSLPTFSFFAESVGKLVERIQANLDRVYKDEKKWTVSLHPEYEGKTNVNISVSNMTVWDALAMVNSQFGATFIIKNRTITVGTAGIAMENVFSYGKGKGLREIERNAESNQKIITRLRAYGSTRNMPSGYYHNLEGSGIPNNMAVNNLMLPDFPIKEDPYLDSKNIEKLGIREGTVFFDGSGDLEEIYPSMEGMTAEDLEKAGVEVQSTGNLDVVLGAEQIADNGKATEENEIQATFTITLKDIGFDINDYLSTSSATIAMKNGMCGGREFEIVSCEKQDDGSHLLTCNRSEDSTLGLYFPYVDYQIKTGDKFVLLNIEMPDVYVKAASQRLLEAAKAYLAKNDYVRYSYSPTVDNIYMARQHDNAKKYGTTSFYETIKEGDLMLFEDDDLGVSGNIIIDTLNIKEDLENGSIPEYQITLRNEKTVGTIEKIQNQIDSIVRNGVGGSENTGKFNIEQITSIVKAVGEKTFLRKDKSDRTPHHLGVGSLSIGDKQITDVTRYTDEVKPEFASDAEIYSALMTDKRIKEGIEGMGDKFLRKDKEDTAHKHITFEEGITVYGLAKMMNLEVEELATIARAIVTTLGSSTFVDGFAGEGYQIWKDIASGDWSMTLDRLTVRKVMMIYELVIQKIRAVGGMIVVSAGNGKVKSVERVGIEYKFNFEDTNTFAVNDLMRCQVFSPSGLKYYWVEVTRVEGEDVYARVADFNGVMPAAGDECVLMGNTKNKLRQNLILISATEDGQPRFDCLDGVRTKNFEGCLRTRVGCLDGISDSRFPSDMQPHGYGLYADNCFLTGVFVLSNGKDVQTQFTIMEGMIRSEISSVRAEINAKDNYLTNASFSSNLESWTYENDVQVFRTSGGLLHFNGNFYSIKNNFAGVVVRDSKNVLRIKNSFITQKNSDYNLHPSFDLYKEEETGIEKYRPRMFYVSFKYLCVEAGTMKVYFKDETNDGTFEQYTSINEEKWIDPNVSFEVEEFEGKWNGTGDFYLSFDGDIYIYDLALSDNALADVEEKFTNRFEATDKKIQANLDYTNGKLEEYHSEFILTAEKLESSFNTKLTNQYNTITTEYSSKITQTAKELRSEYTELVEDTENDITSSYKSLVSQTAREIKAELTELVEDTESGLIEDYESQISATARELRTDFSADFTDLETGLTNSFESSISQTAKEIRAEVSSVEEDLDGRITTNETNISVQAGQITSLTKTVSSHGDSISAHSTKISQNTEAINLRATKEELNALGKTVSQNSSDISVTAGKLEAFTEKITFNSSGEITNFSKSGLYTTSNRATLYSSLVSDGMATKASLSAYVLEDDLGDLVSKIEISADQIDLTGKVTFSDLASGVQTTINGKVNSSSLGSLAYKSAVSSAMLDSTIISGGYIKTSLIDVDAITVNKLEATNSEGWTLKMDSGGFVCENSSGTPLLEINADGLQPAIGIYKSGTGNLTLNALGIGYAPSSGGATTIDSKGLTLASGAKLYNFALGNVSSGSPSITTDFTVMSSSSSLPSASSCKGKVIFIKFNGSKTLSGSIFPRNSTSTVSSVTHNNLSAFYISNGSYWYEFLSVD